MKTNSINNNISFGFAYNSTRGANKVFTKIIQSNPNMMFRRADNLIGVVNAFENAGDTLSVSKSGSKFFKNKLKFRYSQPGRNDTLSEINVSARKFLDNPASYIKTLAGKGAAGDVKKSIGEAKGSTAKGFAEYIEGISPGKVQN